MFCKKKKIVVLVLTFIVAVMFCAVGCNEEKYEKISNAISFENVEKITYTHKKARHDLYVDAMDNVNKTREITDAEKQQLQNLINNSKCRRRTSQREIYQSHVNTIYYYTIYYTDGSYVEIGDLYIYKYNAQGEKLNEFGQVKYSGAMADYSIDAKNYPIDLSIE